VDLVVDVPGAMRPLRSRVEAAEQEIQHVARLAAFDLAEQPTQFVEHEQHALSDLHARRVVLAVGVLPVASIGERRGEPFIGARADDDIRRVRLAGGCITSSA
jgi:hypothetical protein